MNMFYLFISVEKNIIFINIEIIQTLFEKYDSIIVHQKVNKKITFHLYPTFVLLLNLLLYLFNNHYQSTAKISQSFPMNEPFGKVLKSTHSYIIL